MTEGQNVTHVWVWRRSPYSQCAAAPDTVVSELTCCIEGLIGKRKMAAVDAAVVVTPVLLVAVGGSYTHTYTECNECSPIQTQGSRGGMQVVAGW